MDNNTVPPTNDPINPPPPPADPDPALGNASAMPDPIQSSPKPNDDIANQMGTSPLDPPTSVPTEPTPTGQMPTGALMGTPPITDTPQPEEPSPTPALPTEQKPTETADPKTDEVVNKVMDTLLERVANVLTDEDIEKLKELDKKDPTGNAVQYYLISKVPNFEKLLDEEIQAAKAS